MRFLLVVVFFLAGTRPAWAEQEAETAGDPGDEAGEEESPGQESGEEQYEEPDLKKYNSEILYKPKECPRKTDEGDKISVHYTGTLQATGEVFDTSYKREAPFSFNLGLKEVIPGWEMGLVDMCVGEKRRLTIPPKYGYGDETVGPIPAGSTLIFEIELMEIEDGMTPEDLFNKMDGNSDGKVDKDELRAWFIKGAEMHASKEELEEIRQKPEMLDPAINNALQTDDKDRNGYLEWEEVKTKWEEEFTVRHDEL